MTSQYKHYFTYRFRSPLIPTATKPKTGCQSVRPQRVVALEENERFAGYPVRPHVLRCSGKRRCALGSVRRRTRTAVSASGKSQVRWLAGRWRSRLPRPRFRLARAQPANVRSLAERVGVYRRDVRCAVPRIFGCAGQAWLLPSRYIRCPTIARPVVESDWNVKSVCGGN